MPTKQPTTWQFCHLRSLSWAANPHRKKRNRKASANKMGGPPKQAERPHTHTQGTRGRSCLGLYSEIQRSVETQPQISCVPNTVVSQRSEKGSHARPALTPKAALKGSGSLNAGCKIVPCRYLPSLPCARRCSRMPPRPSRAQVLRASTVPFYRWRSQGSG